MLDKYFNFTKVQDEYSVIDSFLEHTRIDEEELGLLDQMVSFSCTQSRDKVPGLYEKITKIHTDSYRMFENIAEQIVQADFDHQKQYDLFRLYNQIDSVSDTIIATAKRVKILHNIGGCMPSNLESDATKMMKNVLKIHQSFKHALSQYQTNKREILNVIYTIVELSHENDDLCTNGIESLYHIGNQGSLNLGDFRAVENVLEYIRLLSKTIEQATTSLEWLLI